MSHTVSDLGLHGYKNWLKSLQPYPCGTVVRFTQPYTGTTKLFSVAAGQEFMVVSIDPGFNRDPVYKMVAHRNGRLFKRTLYWSIEGVARMVIDGQIEIVPQ